MKKRDRANSAKKKSVALISALISEDGNEIELPSSCMYEVNLDGKIICSVPIMDAIRAAGMIEAIIEIGAELGGDRVMMRIASSAANPASPPRSSS